MLRTVVSSQSHHAETRELEDLITEPLPSNGRLRGASLHYSDFQASCHIYVHMVL
jgi:hypothetical protein